MFLDPLDSLGLSWHGVFEPFETAFFKDRIRPGQTIVDIGANIGYFTLLFAQLVGPGGHVYAFEPDPLNFGILKKNVKINGYSNVTLERTALSDTNGKLKLYRSQDNMGDHRTYDPGVSRETIEINCVRLDDYFAKAKKKTVDILKMDIQGAEGQALSGMLEIARQSPDLILMTEYMPEGLARCGTDPSQYLKMLRSIGLSIYYVDRRQGAIREISPESLLTRQFSDESDFLNLICAKTKLSCVRAKNGAKLSK
jgi:FkbM family methyltransferase